MTPDDLLALLNAVDGDFEPALSSRTNLAAYAAKLAERATLFTLVEEQRLTAVAAVYCNDPTRTAAYLSFIAVAPECRGQGLAAILLEACLRYLKARSFGTLKLEVYKSNAVALRMYDRFGFERTGETETSYLLAATLE